MLAPLSFLQANQSNAVHLRSEHGADVTSVLSHKRAI